MNKLEILPMYLPYKLQLKIAEKGTGWRPNGNESTGNKCSDAYLTPDLYADICKRVFPVTFLPCMYELDLTQKIWHNGKEIVPIVELIKMVDPKAEYIIDEEKRYVNYRYKCSNGFDTHYIAGKPEYMEFWVIQYCLSRRINLWLKPDEYISANGTDIYK